MKRIISVFMAFLLLVIVPTNAITVENSPTQKYWWEDTDDYVLLCTEIGKNEVFSVVLFKDDPDYVYQWRHNKTRNRLTEINFITDRDYVESLVIQGAIEVIQISDTMQQEHSIKSGGNVYQKNEVKNAMKQRYGNPRTWMLVYSDYSTYSPLKIRVREDDYIDAEYAGLKQLPTGITMAAAAVSIASFFGVPVPFAISLISLLVETYSALAVLDDQLSITSYRGVYMTQRTGTVQPQSGVETPVVVATRSRCMYYYFAESPTSSSVADDMMADESSLETIYSPSEYDYRVTTLVDKAYEQYVGS